MIRNILFVLIIALLGCETMKLSPEGVAIRTITPVVASSCKYVGLANSFQPVLMGGMAAAQVDIRNKIASLRANAMVITAQYVDPGEWPHGNITAEGYICEFSSDRAALPTSTTGIVLEDMSEAQKANLERNAGAIVKDVIIDSAAWKANIVPSDVLINIDGEEVKNSAHGNRLLNIAFANAKKVQVIVLRKGSMREIVLTK